jgi:hypothetical protein
MGGRVWAWLLPERPRHLPGARAWSIAFRTLHLAAFGLLLGGHAFAVEPDRLLAAISLASVGSHMPARFRHYSILHRRVLGPGKSLGPRLLPLEPHRASIPVGEGRPSA